MSSAPSPRTQVKRGARRAAYEPETIKEILDAGWICHLSVSTPEGPRCIPTIYARQGEEILIHGSAKSGVLSYLDQGPACVVVSLVDGLVLARSAFHHSVNYRCVVLYAQARLVEEREEKLRALDKILDHLLPERSSQCRAPNATELRATAVYAFSIHEASAKIRQGPPNDDAADHELGHWAGVVPVDTTTQPPLAAPDLNPGIATPAALKDYRLPRERR